MVHAKRDNKAITKSRQAVKREDKRMKQYEKQRRSAVRAQKAGMHEDIFFRDEGEERGELRLMLFPLLILQALTLLSILL